MTSDNSNRILSWNTHALLTRPALRTLRSPLLETNAPVITLEDFLSVVARTVQVIITWYWNLLAAKAGNAGPRSHPPLEITTHQAFFEALRLNPVHRIEYVTVIGQEDVSSGTGHDPSRLGPPGSAYVPTDIGSVVSPTEILCTYADEPDWGMDQALFLREDYGYGPLPFGTDTGTSSQAPFHMAFYYENPVLFRLHPQLRKSFMEERIRLFFALGQLAFAHEIDYWGWRFTAWAMHYLQDLTQPYHAKAVPAPLLRILRRVLVAGGIRNAVEKNKNLLRNRHTLFEASVHFMLNDAFKRYSTHPLLLALTGDGEARAGTIRSVMHESAAVAVGLARSTDETVMSLISDPRMVDPEYDLAQDAAYRIDEALLAAARDQPELFERLTRLVCRCFRETGMITRFSVRRMEFMPAPTLP